MTLSDHIGSTSTFTYDKRNLLLSKTNSAYGSTYTFDYEHRLISAGNIQYTYDGAGNRLQKTENGVVTRYIYDAGGNLLAEADGSNNITKYYVHGLGLIAMVTPANQTYSYHYNATGSTIAMTDQTQAIVNKYAYDPFGNITSQQEAISQPFKYVGQFGVMSEANGFYYMRARYYDPNVGRFISEDPIGFEGGDVNLMAYVGGNPVNGIDPSGLYDDHNELFPVDGFDWNRADRGWTAPYWPWSIARHFRGDIHKIKEDVIAAVIAGDKEAFENTVHEGHDYYAHYLQGYRWYTVGHLFAINNPDNDMTYRPQAQAFTNWAVNAWRTKWDNNGYGGNGVYGGKGK